MQSKDESYSTTVQTEVFISYRSYFPIDYAEDGPAFPLLYFMYGSGERRTDLDILEWRALGDDARDISHT